MSWSLSASDFREAWEDPEAASSEVVGMASREVVGARRVDSLTSFRFEDVVWTEALRRHPPDAGR